MAGIYIHIPFCKQACHYCDFHFSTNLDAIQKLTEALALELQRRSDYLGGETIETIYFGGGTPSLLHPDILQELLAAVAGHFEVAPSAEVTLEANPDDLREGKAGDLRSIGVNRLSIGIQSFDADQLTFFNRVHSPAESVSSFRAARAAGFKNISIDLIYGMPGLTHDDWRRNLDKACELDPEHISAYALTIEENTAFGRWQSKGKLIPLDEDVVAEQLETLMDSLAARGYEQYEISNFCKQGFQSRHNSGYWFGKKYLGVGPGAHSFDGKSRQANIRNNSTYMKAIFNEEIPFEKEMLSEEDKINEYILTRLRTSAGCDVKSLRASLGYDLLLIHREYLSQRVEAGHLIIDGDRVALTNRGKLLADKIASDLFVSTK